jgi:thiol-disulfide isomerase/thioredoxin
MIPLRRNILIGAVGICAGFAGIWASLKSLDASSPNVAPLWAAEFKDLEGKPLAMSSLKGKPVVVNFWATWCGPCKEEMPDFQKFATGPDGKKAQLVGIGIDSAAKMQEFAKQMGITYQLVEGGAQGLDILTAAGDKPRALPFTIVLNAAGEPIFSRIGKVSHDELTAIARKF